MDVDRTIEGNGELFMDNKEIEIKIEITYLQYKELLDYFQKTIVSQTEKKQLDNYYSPIGEDYYNAGNRCLRIRNEDSRSILSYKHIYNENTGIQYIEEYETAIGDFEMMYKILEAIGFTCQITVDKYRREFMTEDGYFIALDKVNKLGYFIEIENRNIGDTIEDRNKGLLDFVKLLNLDINMRNSEGYSNMLYRISKEG